MNTESIITTHLQVVNGQPMTTSKDVAQVFNKRHADVIRSIESLQVTDTWYERNFALIQIETDLGLDRIRKDKAYQMTKDGFVFLVMGFTGAKASAFKIAYIEAFNRMSEKLLERPVSPEYYIPKTYVEALELALEQTKALEKAKEEIEVLKPKAEYAEHISDSDSLFTTTQVAKTLGISAVKLNRFLKQKGVLYKQSGSWLPYSDYEDRQGDLFQIITREYNDSSGNLKTTVQLKWTEKGKRFVSSLYGLPLQGVLSVIN